MNHFVLCVTICYPCDRLRCNCSLNSKRAFHPLSQTSISTDCHLFSSGITSFHLIYKSLPKSKIEFLLVKKFLLVAKIVFLGPIYFRYSHQSVTTTCCYQSPPGFRISFSTETLTRYSSFNTVTQSVKSSTVDVQINYF